MLIRRRLTGYISFFIVLTMLILFAGCSNEDQEPSDETAGKASVSESSTVASDSGSDMTGTDGNYLTAAEAVELAYEEAKKWSGDSLFKSITVGSSLSVHYNWTETGMAYHWTADFISPEKKQMIFVYVNYGSVDRTLVKEYSMKKMPPAGHPNDKPLISLQEANEIAVREGGAFGLMPADVRYDTCGYSDKEIPYWGIVYRVPLPDGSEEKHFYYINAETGELSDALFSDDENNSVDREDLLVKERDLSGYAHMQDQRYTVIKFLTLINEGRTDEAVGMMDGFMSPDKSSGKMWIQNLSSIAGHKFTSGGFVTEDEDSWTEDTKRFEIRIDILCEGECEHYGWSRGLAKRWITLKRYDDIWMIHELSSSP